MYVVFYSNYFPREVDSIWDTHEHAEERQRKLNAEADDANAWNVEPWVVSGTVEQQ